MRSSRRAFLCRAVGGVLGAGGLGASGLCQVLAESGLPPESGAVPIVDTHQHLWDLTRFHLPWLKSSSELNRSFLPHDYEEATRGLGVVKAVYMEVAVDPDEQLAEAEYVVELCQSKSTPTVAAVIGGQPASPGFKAYITRFQGSPYVKGVRQIPPAAEGQSSLWRQKAFLAGIRLLGELGMSFDLCMAPEALPEAIHLVDECPGTRFILDHCGNADPKAFRADDQSERSRKHREQWRRDIAALAERKHVVCKISGIVARMPKGQWTAEDLAPVVEHCFEVFGPDRVMFASDWPVCTRGATLRQWVEALRQIVRTRSREFQQKLFHDNAVRFYGLV